MSLQTVIAHLKQNMPGQSEEWYQQVAVQIRQENGNQPAPQYQQQQQSKGVNIPVHPETRKRLINMCGGDVALAESLAGSNIQADWDTAIWKLERDRR